MDLGQVKSYAYTERQKENENNKTHICFVDFQPGVVLCFVHYIFFSFLLPVTRGQFFCLMKKKSHSKRHKLNFGGLISMVIVLTMSQK